MSQLSPCRVRSLVALSAFLLTGQAAAEKVERLERFKEQTVMITVTHRDQSVERGSGVVLCQEHGRAYVLTAYRLLAGKLPPGRKVLRRPARTEIRFFDDNLPSFVDDRADVAPAGATAPRRGVTLYKHGEFHGPRESFYEDDPNLGDNPIGNDTVSSLRVDPGCQAELFEHTDYRGRSTTLSYKEARLWGTEVGRDNISSLKVSCQEMDERGLTYHQVPEDGLVLLSFPFQPLRWTAATRRGKVESWGSSGLFNSKQPIVSSVGYQSSTRDNWVHRSGRLVPGGGRLLHHSTPIDPGFLGGPLFNKKSLIGINLRRVTGAEIGAEAGTVSGDTVSGDTVSGDTVSGDTVSGDTVYGEALSVRRILPAIGKWLPERCQFWIGNRVDLFLPPVTDTAPVPAVAQADPEPMADRRGVTLYEHASFRGRSETFYGAEKAAATDTIAARHQPVSAARATEAHATREGSRVSGGADQLPFEPLGQAARARLSRSFQLAVSEQHSLDMSVDPERLDEQTVMISVTRGRSVEHGAGIVLCEENRRAYVLTAHHVLAGKRLAGDKRAVVDVEQSSGLTEIQFFRQSVPSVVGGRTDGQAVMNVHHLPEADLALLTIPVLGEPESRPSRIRPSAWARASARGEPDVLAVGYRKRPLESWALEAGKLLAGGGKRLRHSAAIVEGFSGGPLFHGSGALIGINLERIAGETIGAEAGTFYGQALAMEEVLPLIRPWLPESCLTTMETAMGKSIRAIEATAFLAVADKMKRVGSDREFGFGGYRITEVHGGAVRQFFSRTNATRKYSFSIDESSGTVWQGRCAEEIKAEEQGSKLLNFVMDQVLDESLVVAINTSLSCTFDRQGGEKTTELVLEERDEFNDVKGTGKVGGVQIEVVGTKSSVNYLFHVGGRMIGAVRKADSTEFWPYGGYSQDEGETVWLDPSVTGEVRSACAAAAAALLLHARLE